MRLNETVTVKAMGYGVQLGVLLRIAKRGQFAPPQFRHEKAAWSRDVAVVVIYQLMNIIHI